MNSPSSAHQPNILLVLVDELRFPSALPTGVNTPAEFLARFMPNTYRQWQRGVKFTRHYTAGVACTPARGTLISGLYTQQTWVLQTFKGTPSTRVSVPPVLDPAFPTYGRLLRKAGYQTPYIGKWHVSLPRTKDHMLEAYGFQGFTDPDPSGANLQGTVGDAANGYLNDKYIADQAVRWLSARKSGEAPWCLTVGFVNPHDQQFFWGGTEFQTYNELFDAQSALVPFNYYSQNDGQTHPPVVDWDADPLRDPPSCSYNVLPPNWESASTIAASKPATQIFGRNFQAAVWGGIADDPSQTAYSVTEYPGSQT
jgi:uncharacterized sulfatase